MNYIHCSFEHMYVFQSKCVIINILIQFVFILYGTYAASVCIYKKNGIGVCNVILPSIKPLVSCKVSMEDNYDTFGSFQ